MTPAPSTKHQRICLNIAQRLDSHARRGSLGTALISPVDVVFSEEDVVQPDVIFVSAARASIITEKNVAGAPDLVVEVLSTEPSGEEVPPPDSVGGRPEATRKTDLTVKFKLYAARGVREYWVVDPAIETLIVFRAGEEGFTRASELSREAQDSVETPLLPGLTVPLPEIFA